MLNKDTCGGITVKMRFEIILLAALLVAACSAGAYHAASASNSDTETAIVVDTDMGLDDVRAIFALLASGIDIDAIVTVDGSAAVGKGTDNLVGLLESIPRNDIAVYRGTVAPLHEPPPWRHTANTLGGGSFAPPRRIESRAVTPEGLAQMLESGNRRIHYLALGPLCNIAALVREHPAVLSVVETVWIPAKIDSAGAVTGWNLRWDPKAAASVLRGAPEIVLLDLPGAGAIDARAILTEVAGTAAGAADEAPAARWISRTLPAGDAGQAHLFMHDELAAAALIEPELISVTEESYRASFPAGVGIVLDRHEKGNIRIARINEPGRATDLLRRLWQSPIPAEHRHGGNAHLPGVERGIPVELLLGTFHGHLGPYVVLGYRMGKLAVETAGTRGHFGIEADVYSILEPPPSCLIDGVQLGSGCTLGKRNITVHETGGPAHVIFATNGGMKIRIGLRTEVPGLVTRLVEERGVEAAGREILGMKTGELFEIEIIEPAGNNQ